MNVVYESENMTVVDDRNFITIEEAYNLLRNGESIQIGDPPDYSAENEFDIHSAPITVYLGNCLCEESWKNILRLSDDQIKTEASDYLKGYELSR